MNNKFIKECILKSLVSLMKEKEFKDITITEITKKAGVSRMTYYRNYNFKEDILNDYMTTLIEQTIKGTKPRGAFKKELQKHGATNAEVIARTEAAKLQTVVLESRATDIGSVAYIWLASKDKRTRKSHREMDGVVVFWKFEKPLLDEMRGHAGQFPNCRCSPEPIFDEDDLTKSNYRVYNYKTDNVINMTKKELLEALKRGQL